MLMIIQTTLRPWKRIQSKLRPWKRATRPKYRTKNYNKKQQRGKKPSQKTYIKGSTGYWGGGELLMINQSKSRLTSGQHAGDIWYIKISICKYILNKYFGEICWKYIGHIGNISHISSTCWWYIMYHISCSWYIIYQGHISYQGHIIYIKGTDRSYWVTDDKSKQNLTSEVIIIIMCHHHQQSTS